MNIRTDGWKWTLAFLGFPIGGLIANIVLGEMSSVVEGAIGGALSGGVVGLFQWLALRHYLPTRWIMATTIGFSLGIALSILLVGTSQTTEAIAFRALTSGVIISISQWIVLPKNSRTWLWIPVVAISYVLGWLVTAQVIGANVNQGFTVFGASGAIIFQVLTGLALCFIAPKFTR